MTSPLNKQVSNLSINQLFKITNMAMQKAMGPDVPIGFSNRDIRQISAGMARTPGMDVFINPHTRRFKPAYTQGKIPESTMVARMKNTMAAFGLDEIGTHDLLARENMKEVIPATNELFKMKGKELLEKLTRVYAQVLKSF